MKLLTRVKHFLASSLCLWILVNHVFSDKSNESHFFTFFHRLKKLMVSSYHVRFAKRSHSIHFYFLPRLLRDIAVVTSFSPFDATDLFRYLLKTSGFLMFSGGIERDQWHELG